MFLKIVIFLASVIALVTTQRAGNEEGEIDDLFKKNNNSTLLDDEPKVNL